MDQKRLIIAIVLSILLFIGIQFFMGPEEKAPSDKAPPPPDVVQEQPITDPATVPEQRTPLAQAPVVLGDSSGTTKMPTEPVQTQNVTVETNLFSVTLSGKGATIQELALKQYAQTIDENSPPQLLVSPEKNPNGTVQTSIWANGTFDQPTIYTTSAPEKVVAIAEKQDITFVYKMPEGLLVTKTYTFEPNSYIIGLTIQVNNMTQKTLSDRLSIALQEDFGAKGQSYAFEGPIVKMGKDLIRIKTKKIKDKDRYTGKIDWIADSGRYFLASILPPAGEEYDLRLTYSPEKILTSTLTYPEKTIQPGQTATMSSELYFGPKSISILETVGHELQKVVNFGFFDLLAKPFLWFMTFLYGFLPNYGLAIILMTIAIKILLWPLSAKSYKSMAEMRKIQPLLTSLREKHRNDKQKLNQEMMSLYKTYKINPLGGCLPMILQIPVFFALYRMLYEAIELRHAPFFGWIQDLSAPDRLFNFPITVPYMEPPYGIPVLTILMGASMFLQQKMTPIMGDASQQKIMMLMPIIFTVIFINFSAGLVLYWFVNNLVSIGQQYYVQKKYS